MTEEEVRAEVGTKAIKFIDEHEKDCLTGFEMMRDFAYEVTKDLEKENAELQKEIRCECTRCVYSDSPCIRSDYGVENNEDVCPNYENVFVAYTQLKEENAELKEKYVKNITDCDICDTYCNSQLIKAKDIMKRLVDLSNSSRSLLGDTWHETVREAEDFLKENE